ncbi:MAG: mercuric transporter MerT family protein [Thermoanaerobaculia bacterium]
MSPRWVPMAALASALGASVCCVLPLVAAFLGVGSAALAARFAPLHPYLTVLTLALLGYAFYRTYGGHRWHGSDLPATEVRRRRVLWSAAIASLLLLGSPYLLGWLA